MSLHTREKLSALAVVCFLFVGASQSRAGTPVKENGEASKSRSTGVSTKTQGERQHCDEPWDSRQYRANTEPWHWRTAAAPPNASELSRVPVMLYVRTLAMRVRYRILSFHAACTRMPDTTLCGAVENHTKGESTTRHPLVLAVCLGSLCATPLRKGHAALSAAGAKKQCATHGSTRETQLCTAPRALIHSFIYACMHVFIHSFVRLSPHSTARASTERVESHDTALAQLSLSKSVLCPASPSTSSDVPSSVSCVCVTFLLTGGSCRSLLCRSVCLVATWCCGTRLVSGTCGDLFRSVVFSGRAGLCRWPHTASSSIMPRFRTEAPCVANHTLPAQPGQRVAVPCLFATTTPRERIAMPLRGPCCPPLDSRVSSLRAWKVRVGERRVAYDCCTGENTCSLSFTVTEPVCRGQAAGSERRTQCCTWLLY